MKLKLGARGSQLSLAQARLVIASLQGRVEVELVVVKTTGDRLSAAGSPIEWKGDFTRELDEALLDGRIDFAVHSMKDVPTRVPEGLALAAVPVREDPSDVLIARPRRSFEELPVGTRVGTASPRRKAQLLAARPDLEVLEARGNGASHHEALAERSLLSTLEAGCKAPVAGLARVSDGSLTLSAGVFSPDGSSALREQSRGPAWEAVSIGRDVGRKLLDRGAAALIEAASR